MEDEIPALLEDSLQALEVNESFDIMGNTYTLLAEPSSIVADEDGLSIGMSSQFYADNWFSMIQDWAHCLETMMCPTGMPQPALGSHCLWMPSISSSMKSGAEVDCLWSSPPQSLEWAQMT